jgi:hypothetical protein
VHADNRRTGPAARRHLRQHAGPPEEVEVTGIWTNNFLCETLGGLKETGEDGTYTGSFRVKGYKDADHEEQTDIAMFEEDHPES